MRSGVGRLAIRAEVDMMAVIRHLRIIFFVAAAATGVSCPALAQSTTPNVVSPSPGLETPLTFTTTTCMMSCNGRFANCQSSCIVSRLPPGTLVRDPNLSAGGCFCHRVVHIILHYPAAVVPDRLRERIAVTMTIRVFRVR